MGVEEGAALTSRIVSSASTGLYGGAFDPPHLGHVALARAAKARFELPRLVVLVAVEPGHKHVDLDAGTRLELARAAFPDEDVRLDDHPRTIDLLREERWPEPLFLIGADQFCDFLSWADPDGVLERARLGVATRPGFPAERLNAVLDRLSRPERVLFFGIEPYAISSSEVRARAAQGLPLDDLVPAAVARLIAERHLYRPSRS
jgi:nicotinate-nucleotide adenylyltransferase